MKHQNVSVFKNEATLREKFNKLVYTIEKIENLPNFDKGYYSISHREAKVETPEYVTYFVVENKEFFMGKYVDYVYFDEGESFDSSVVNEAIQRILRTNMMRKGE
jgi:hypothetical protein